MYTLLAAALLFHKLYIESLFVCNYICYYVYTCKPVLTSDYKHELCVTTFGLLCSSNVLGYNYSSNPDNYVYASEKCDLYCTYSLSIIYNIQ